MVTPIGDTSETVFDAPQLALVIIADDPPHTEKSEVLERFQKASPMNLGFTVAQLVSREEWLPSSVIPMASESGTL